MLPRADFIYSELEKKRSSRSILAFCAKQQSIVKMSNSHSLLKTLVATQLHLHGLCIQRSHKEGQSRMRTLGESNKIPRSHL